MARPRPRTESVLKAYTGEAVPGNEPNSLFLISVIWIAGDIGFVRKPEPARPRWSG